MTAEHWDARYVDVGSTNVSWFQESPQASLDLITGVAEPSAALVDVGGGASRLVDALLDRGFHDITVVDLSQQALAESHARVGDAPVHWVVADVRDWQPEQAFDVWHDRAAYHFLVDADEQQRYWDLVRATVPVGAHVVMGTFAEDGPQMCSGLPVHRYSAGDLAAAMGEGFEILDTVREEHVTPTGGVQSFTWVLARRC